MEVNSVTLWQKQHSARKKTIHQQIGFQFMEETSKMLHLERSVLWCWKLNISKSRSEISCKVWNVVLEKDGWDQVDRSCEKRKRSNLIKHNSVCYNSEQESVEIANKMQAWNRIYYSTVHLRLNMFRAVYRSSSGALTVFAASGLHTNVVTGRSQIWVGTIKSLQSKGSLYEFRWTAFY